MSLSKLKGAGDTIVEVLIALAVLSAVLGGAYLSANRSLASNRDSQERGEALKLAEGQIEQLKSLAKTTPSVLSTGGVFCIDSANSIKTNDGMVSDPFPSLDGDTLATPNYNLGCIQKPSGVSYYMSISGSSNLFTIRSRWNRINGGGNNEVKLTYRLY
jgi:type II secretory pathway pseudopilin PulG